MKGHTDGSAAYNVTSPILLDPIKYPLDCETSSVPYNTLTHALGIRDWLERTAAAAVQGGMAKLTKLDKLTYNSEITITIDGSGTFTYNFPFGTNFLNALGSYKLDESIAIAFTAEPSKGKTTPVRTLPAGAQFSSITPSPTNVVSPAAQSRLDTLSLQQSIINLQTAIQQQRRF